MIIGALKMGRNDNWQRRISTWDSLLLILFMLPWQRSTDAFNVDFKHPIVYSGPRNSYFGYSVTFGQKNQNYWLLVGAPKGNQSSQPYLVEPGAIYQCPFTAGRKCTELVVNQKGNIKGTYFGNSYQNMHDGAWLGVSLDTNHDRSLMVACAHRWQNQVKYQEWRQNRFRDRARPQIPYANGICYTMTPELSSETMKKYIPLLPNSYQVLNDGIPDYAFGMAGISAHFTQDDRTNELVVGAPGVYIWDGNVVSIIPRDENDNRKAPFVWGPGERTRFAYFGYSVSSGIFSDNDHTPLKLVGAPRFNYTGKVYLVSQVRATRHVRRKWEGEHMGDYFGASVCATDLNGDHLADVIIGAPFYADQRPNTYDQGKVYVSLNLKMMNFAHAKSEPPWIELVGSMASNARFGSAVGCIGDLDMDDYNDIAVGAPYEDEGRGAIYIFYGDKETGIAEDLGQRLLAKEIDRNLRGFGISFAKSLDVDRNAFPDMGIGSYVSGQAAILRTRPVIIPSVAVTTDPQRVSVALFNCRYKNKPVRCFNTTVCFSYKTKSNSLNLLPSLDFNYTLSVDVYHKGEPVRGNIELNGQVLKDTITDTIGVKRRSRETCISFKIVIRNETRNYMVPIAITVQSSPIPCRFTQPPQFFERCPVIHPRSKSHALTEVSFLNGCQNGGVCESDLKLQAAVTYENMLVSYPSLKVGVNKTLTINTTISNSREYAYLSELNITLSENLELEKLRQTTCSEIAVGKQFRYILCDIGNPLAAATPVVLQLTFNLEKLTWANPDVHIMLSVQTGSNEVNMKDNSEEFLIGVYSEADIYVTGADYDQYVSYANNTGETVNFTHRYRLFNDGPATVPQVQVKILVPEKSGYTTFLHQAYIEPADGKVARVTECRGASARYLTASGEDKDNMPTPEALRKRRKREINQARPKQDVNGLPLFCSRTTQCKTIECDVTDLQAHDSVGFKVEMEVIPKELDNLKIKQGIIDFTTRAEAHIVNAKPYVQPPKPKADFDQLATSLDSGRRDSEALEDWIIPVSIIAGFLLLLLIALIFYKIGFFQRTQRETMKQMKQEENENPADSAAFQNPSADEELIQDEQMPQS